eukprot:4813885-Pleurochrysis_carterae.AAC.1
MCSARTCSRPSSQEFEQRGWAPSDEALLKARDRARLRCMRTCYEIVHSLTEWGALLVVVLYARVRKPAHTAYFVNRASELTSSPGLQVLPAAAADPSLSSAARDIFSMLHERQASVLSHL